MPDTNDPTFDPASIIDLSDVSLMTSGYGLRFGRMPDGSVAILVDSPSLAESKTIVIPDNIWASLIAHVSVRGEASGQWHMAMAYHNDASARVVVINESGKLREV